MKEKTFSGLLIVLHFLTNKNNKRKPHTNLNLCLNKKKRTQLKPSTVPWEINFTPVSTLNHDNNCWDSFFFSEPARLHFCGLCDLAAFTEEPAWLLSRWRKPCPADSTSTTNFPTILVVRTSQENPLPIATKSCKQWITGWALSLQLSRRLSS